MQIEPKIGLEFLNRNLLKYYQNKKYSVEGIPCRIDVMGDAYKTYSVLCTREMVERLDVANGTLPSSLKTIKELVNVIIQGLISAKEAEKPEGLEAEKRPIEIHWRMYPSVDVDGDYSSRVTFRVSVHHKP